MAAATAHIDILSISLFVNSSRALVKMRLWVSELPEGRLCFGLVVNVLRHRVFQCYRS